MVHVDITPSSTFLLVHDVTNGFVDPTHESWDEGLVPMLANIRTLLDAARAAGLQIVYIGSGQGDPSILPANPDDERMAWGGPGCDVPADLGPLPGEKVVRKPRWGGFYGSELATYLKANGLTTMIICGISLAGGVELTVREAFNRDLKSIVVYDACLTRPIADQGWGAVSKEEAERVILTVLAQRFARVTTTSDIASELMRLAPVAGSR